MEKWKNGKDRFLNPRDLIRSMEEVELGGKPDSTLLNFFIQSFQHVPRTYRQMRVQGTEARRTRLRLHREP